MSKFKSDRWIPPSRIEAPSTAVLDSSPRPTPAVVRAPLPQPRSLDPEPLTTPVSRAGFLVAMVYACALFSLVNEFTVVVVGMKPYVTWVTGPLAIIAAIASGNLFRCWRPGPGRWLILFTVWALLAAALGIYHRGSLDIMQEYTLKQFPVLLMLAALITGLQQVEWCCRMMGFAGLILVGFGLKFGGYIDNRWVIPKTSLENPNDFATHLLIALPFCLLLVLNSSRFSWLKLVGIAGMAALVLAVLASGSRGGLIALLAVVLVLLWQAPQRLRLAMVAACLACGIIAGVMFPQVLWNRFLTIISSETSANATDTEKMAVASTADRWYLFVRSLEVTAQHPLFGVGPGNFIVAEVDAAKEEGKRGAWLGTHNSYTQASSEGGIPGFVFFTAALAGSIRRCASIYRRTRRHPQLRRINNTALCLLLSLVGFAVNILFAHLVFTFYLPMLVGLTVAFVATAGRATAAALK